MTRRKPQPAAPDPRAPWQIEQGARCGCRGTDDLCACQNETPWPRPAIDWQARALAAEELAETLTTQLRENLEQFRSAQVTQRAAEQRLEQIARMRLFPDDTINRTTLLAAIQIARGAHG